MADTSPTDSDYTVSIVLPAYNEAAILADTVTALRNWAEKHDEHPELIIVEDGCTDATPDISRTLADEYNNVQHIHRDNRLGKGKAIETGFAAASTDVLCFMDVDLATDLDCLPALLEPLRSGDADITIGSRYLPDSDTDRTRGRKLLSIVYNKLTGVALQTGLTDHNCGFKAMRKSVFEQLNDGIDADAWFWDAELLFKAKQQGLNVAEVPVQWREQPNSSLKASDLAAETFAGIARLRGEQVFGDRYPLVQQYGKFAVIGGLGAVLNTVLLYVLTEFFNLYYLYSAVAAIEASIVVMFFLNNRFTFNPVKTGVYEIVDGLIRSNLIRSAGIGIQLALLYAFTEFLGLYYLISNILAIVAASVVNFVAEKRLNWRE